MLEIPVLLTSRNLQKNLKRSAQLNPDHADTYFWTGVAYFQLKQPTLESKSYIKALSLDSRYLQARTYLAHNQFVKGTYSTSLSQGFGNQQIMDCVMI
jgi:hypothetical protein